jgi:large conductance mechanosensitive channel
MKKFFSEFREFALKGSFIDLAVGIIIGTAFNGVINSLVKDIVLPPIGLFLNKVDFSNLFFSLNHQSYATLADAEKAGAPLIKYGLFINTIISFLITALAVFVVIHWMNRIRRRRETGQEKSPTTKPCPYCLSDVPLKATRCPHCTSTIS